MQCRVISIPLVLLSLLLGDPAAQAADPGTGDLPAPAPRTIIAALGRVEPVSEEIRIAAAMTGRLAEVRFDEGQSVRAGEIVATLENADHQARILAAQANVAIAKASLDRVINGARTSEREEAAAVVREAEAVLARAEREVARQLGLAEKQVGSGQDLDDAHSSSDVARAQLARARAHLAVVDSPARVDERERAEAELALALARLQEAHAVFEKSLVRSPIDGVVLRRFRRAGEQVTEMGDTPILAVGDLSHLRVRAEVDEADIALVRPGQDAYIQADAYGDRRISGTVGRLGELMGRKQIVSDDPAERKDRRVLEVLIDLEPGVSMPVGLRVDAYIRLAPSP
jgi:HlyD family secretion protein